jgi:hypothetical protein
MTRQTITIQDLKDNIKYEWRPVCAEFDEDEEGNNQQIVKVDLICEWRMPDRKILFVEIPYETDEELKEIVAALQGSIEPFAKALAEKFGKLKEEKPSDVS